MLPDNNNTDREFRYASPDQLRIGLYVYVDLPWFQHPFTLNSFRISSAEQIVELRALKLQRFRYDPDRSEAIPAESATAASGETAASSADTLPQSEADGDSVTTEEAARAQQQREHRQAVAQMERAFVKATGIMRRLTKDILLHPRECLEEMGGLVDQMATVFLERANVSLHVMGEKCGGEEAYFHGLNVSILSMLLVKGLNLTAEQARTLASAALLHDIGKIEIPDRILMKSPDEYTRAERELHASHVDHGVRIGTQLELAPEILAIFAQHHEMADGSGYPRKLRMEQIAPLARVVSLVNFYDNLCNPVVINQAMTPHEALSFIFARCRGKFDVLVLQLLIRSLGVYPPGTIVKLTNDAIAMVVSVNPQKALRPWVLLYDAGVPQHEAIVLDLEQETGVSIAKSLRPVLLAPAVYSYLSPRRRITYFFDSEVPAPGERA